jgi:hypothetical protein
MTGEQEELNMPFPVLLMKLQFLITALPPVPFRIPPP